MSIVKTKGIVIAENNYQDYDKMLTILTPGFGKISCIAKGARRTTSKILAGTQLFSFCDYVLFKSKDVYHVNQADTIEIFYGLRNSYEKLELAIKINKIVFANTFEDENSYKILILYINFLYHLSNSKNLEDLDFLEAVFKLKFTKYLGLMPKYSKCGVCNQTEQKNFKTFDITNACIKCEKCKTKTDIEINSSVYLAIKYVFEIDDSKLFDFSLKDDSRKMFVKLANEYFNDKVYNV